MSEQPARPRPAGATTILVTGFGGFPGAPRNPTEWIAAALAGEAPRFARLGIALRCAVLPVRYDGLDARIAALAREHRPDAWLLLGVAGRRRRLCIETAGRNRAAPWRADAIGRLPGQVLLPGGPTRIAATLPCPTLLAALRRAGLPVQLSPDAGDYLCNAALYGALAASAAPAVGFLHVPPPIPPRARSDRRRRSATPGVTAAGLLLAARVAVLTLAPIARRAAEAASDADAAIRECAALWRAGHSW